MPFDDDYLSCSNSGAVSFHDCRCIDLIVRMTGNRHHSALGHLDRCSTAFLNRLPRATQSLLWLYGGQLEEVPYRIMLWSTSYLPNPTVHRIHAAQ